MADDKRLETRIEELRFDVHREEAFKRHADHETRLRALEDDEV